MSFEDKKINTPIQDLVNSTQKDSTIGPLVGSIIVILIIILGGLYFFSTLISYKKEAVQTELLIEEQKQTIEIEQTAKQSESVDVNSIKSDLKSTDIDTLDAGLEQIEKEF